MWVTDNMLSAGLSQIIEAGINGLLRQDPHLLSSLNQIASGKSLRMICTRAGAAESQPAWQLTLIITADKVHVHSNSRDDVDACITGSARALSALLFGDDPAAALYHPDIVLSGDVHLIQKIHKTLSAADTRWDDLLAPILKPVLGDHGIFALSNTVNTGVQAARNAGQTLKLDIRDYLQEESGLLPTRVETEMANNQLDALRLRIDRLHARIEILKQHKL